MANNKLPKFVSPPPPPPPQETTVYHTPTLGANICFIDGFYVVLSATNGSPIMVCNNLEHLQERILQKYKCPLEIDESALKI